LMKLATSCPPASPSLVPSGVMAIMQGRMRLLLKRLWQNMRALFCLVYTTILSVRQNQF
jgi:hypothetical protein